MKLSAQRAERGENADWQRCERMTDWVVFSWYVANLGAAAGGVCLRAHSPRKLSKWRLPCNEVGCWLLSVAERMVAAAALSSRSMQTSFFYAPRHFLAHFWTPAEH